MAKNEGCYEEGLQGQDSATLTAHRLRKNVIPLTSLSVRSKVIASLESRLSVCTATDNFSISLSQAVRTWLQAYRLSRSY